MQSVTIADFDVTDDDEGVTEAETSAMAAIVAGGPPGIGEEWDVDLVKDRLVDAIRLVQRTAGRVGPRGHGRTMPDYEYSSIDRWYQQTQEAWEREHGDRERNRPTIGASAEEIREADEALGWIPRFVSLEQVRRALNTWLLAKATRRPWKKVTKELGLVHRTAIARRDRALALIVYGLTVEAAEKAAAAEMEDAD